MMRSYVNFKADGVCQAQVMLDDLKYTYIQRKLLKRGHLWFSLPFAFREEEI
jgi:hypothetical protein